MRVQTPFRALSWVICTQQNPKEQLSCAFHASLMDAGIIACWNLGQKLWAPKWQHINYYKIPFCAEKVCWINKGEMLTEIPQEFHRILWIHQMQLNTRGQFLGGVGWRLASETNLIDGAVRFGGRPKEHGICSRVHRGKLKCIKSDQMWHVSEPTHTFLAQRTHCGHFALINAYSLRPAILPAIKKPKPKISRPASRK